MGQIVLIIIAFLVLLIILILTAPIKYHVDGQIASSTTVNTKVSWLFRFVKLLYSYTEDESTFVLKIGLYKIDLLQPSKRPKKKETKKHKKSKFKVGLTKVDIKSIMSLGILFIRKLFATVKPKYFRVQGVVGLNDPYSTGRFIGYYEAFSSALGLRSAIDIYGDFSQKKLELDLNVFGKFSIGQVLWLAIWLCFKKPMRDMIFSRKGRN